MPRTKFCNETLTCARSTEANLKIRDTTRPPSNVLILFSLLASFSLPLPSCNESLPFGKGKVYLSSDELRGGWYFSSPWRREYDNDAVGKVFVAESPSRQGGGGGGRRWLIRQTRLLLAGRKLKINGSVVRYALYDFLPDCASACARFLPASWKFALTPLHPILSLRLFRNLSPFDRILVSRQSFSSRLDSGRGIEKEIVRFVIGDREFWNGVEYGRM